MSLSGLLSIVVDDPQLRRALEQAAQPAAGGADLIAPPALRPVLAAAPPGAAGPLTGAAVSLTGAAGQQPGAGRFVLAITATAREAEDLTAALGSLLGEPAVAYFPAWETLPHGRLSRRADTSGRRVPVPRV